MHFLCPDAGALTEAGFDGALSIEWEDSKVEQYAGAAASLRALRAMDLPPSAIAFDAAFAKDA